MSGSERNTEVVLAYVDMCWGQGDLDFGATIVPDDYGLHVPPGVPNGYAEWRTGVEHFQIGGVPATLHLPGVPA